MFSFKFNRKITFFFYFLLLKAGRPLLNSFGALRTRTNKTKIKRIKYTKTEKKPAIFLFCEKQFNKSYLAYKIVMHVKNVNPMYCKILIQTHKQRVNIQRRLHRTNRR